MSIKKFFEIIEDILFIAVIVFLCMLLYSVKVNKVVSIFDYRFYRIVSNSMEPVLTPNTCIISVKVSSDDELKEGDIITFISHDDRIYGEYNTHRIYKKVVNDKTGEVRYITKGDFFDVPDDSYVELKDIKGKYVRKLPFSKVISFLVIRLSNSWVYFIVIMIPLIYCLLSYIYKLAYLLMIGDEEDEENEENISLKELYLRNKKINKNK